LPLAKANYRRADLSFRFMSELLLRKSKPFGLADIFPLHVRTFASQKQAFRLGGYLSASLLSTPTPTTGRRC
jgi:hypothetical protein